jgi:cytochrome c oxidase cbb3-type subunit 3
VLHSRLMLVVALATLACTPRETPASPETPAPTSTSSAAVSVAPSAAPASAPDPAPSAADGAAIYAKYCTLCHGANAEGYAADNAPSLVSSTFLSTASDAFLRAGIERGRPGTAMGGFGRIVGGPLGPTEVDAIIAFLRSKNPTPQQTLPNFMAGGDVASGAQIYARECQQCHGTQTQRGNAVHLANPLFLATASDAFIRHAVVHGRPGTPMASFAPRLDGRATNDVVTYVRFLGANAPPLSSLQPPLPAVTAPPTQAPVIPEWPPIPTNPKGAHPKFTLRDGRFAPMAEVKKALDEKKKIIIVDARAPSDWLTLHIPGSVPLPYYDLKLIDRIPNDDTWVIAYCGCPHHASGEVVDALRRRGHKNSAVLDEGMFAWQKADYPVVQAPGMPALAAPPIYKDDKPQPLPSPSRTPH